METETLSFLDNIMPLILEWGPEALVALLLVILPSTRIPLIGKFLGKMSDAIDKKEG